MSSILEVIPLSLSLRRSSQLPLQKVVLILKPQALSNSEQREYAAQSRTVTSEDYESLVRRIYPAIEDIYVIGGENMPIPQFGRVFIVVKPKTGNNLSQIAKNFIKKSLDPFRVASLDIQFMDPEILNVEVVSAVYFDEKKTIKTSRQSLQVSNNTRKVR